MKIIFYHRSLVGTGILLLLLAGNVLHANPTGGTVTQGAANFNSSGSQFNINQSSANAFINWQTFNIGLGETVNFNQPSASSVTWNRITDPNPSQILGSLNANGYVILQNSSGFYVGGQASITAHGLIMTTASTPAFNLSTGGPWSFNTPPPTAKIINYGQINIAGGGSAYLIANDIENNGSISAPGGKIGLYAGQKVLVSTSPDGRGLSAEATIPQGLVDNKGKLVADAGRIALQAKVVNQNGLIQANSAKEVNGTIELVGSDTVNLGANSVISAQGDTDGNSPGGSVTIKSDNRFSDQAGSSINIAGGAQGGNGGQVEISASAMTTINTQINGRAQPGWTGGSLFLDPDYIVLGQTPGGGINVNGASGSSLVGDNPGTTLSLDVGTFANSYSDSAFIGLSQITLQAKYNITLNDNTTWNLSASTGQTSGQLNLQAGGNIIFGNGATISDANNWSVSLQAGYDFVNNVVQNGIGSIYIGDFNGSNPLNNSGSIQTGSGSINLTAGQDILVGSGFVNTIGGGNIDVTAENGNVNTGTSVSGFTYHKTAPYYTVSSSLGGISTKDGGNVTINAGGDVISFPAKTAASNPNQAKQGDPDPGTGAFGSAPGNVTINAGGSVYGCFVVMNGTGIINAGKNIGTGPSPSNPNANQQNVALSLAKGSWNLNAQGNIFLQEVRNPNGLFNNQASFFGTAPGEHLFDYDPQASLTLTAGNGVYLTAFDLPRPDGGVPLMLPPIVTINAGPGGVVLDTPSAIDANGNDVSYTLLNKDITLFPSPYQNLAITTTGGGWLSSGNANGTFATLLMSDSGLKQWYNTASGGSGVQPFGENDHASVPALLNNNEPVTINLAGSQLVNGIPVLAGMENVTLQADKATQINVAGDMIGCSFYGENLRPSDVTSINVGGQIYNAGSFTSVTLNQGLPSLPATDTPFANELPAGASLSSWYLALALAVDPNSAVFQQSYTLSQLANENPFQPGGVLYSALKYSSLLSDLANNLVYNPNIGTLTAIGPLSSDLFAALESPTLTVVRIGANGYPQLKADGQFVLDTINWMSGSTANASSISTLYGNSQGNVPLSSLNGAYIVGGTGQFNVTAGSISLGNAYGILSVGNGIAGNSPDYSFLAPYITSGANINVQVKANLAIPDANGSLVMPASTIASLAGGSVTVNCDGEIPNSPVNDNGVGVSMDLGSQELLGFESQIMGATSHNIGLGIYTTGGGNVNVTAVGTINVDSSRIATFDGGNITVESKMGDVNAGSGGSSLVPVYYYAPDYVGNNLIENVPANGIIAGTLTAARRIPTGAVRLPGNITVITPQGSIYANAGGISQIAYDEILSASSGSTTIGLFAGTPVGFNGDWYSEDNDWSTKPPLYAGNIVLGNFGVIGVNVVVKATGTVTGLIISQQNADINAGQSFAGTVFAGGKATLSTPGTISGTIIAAGGVNTSGGGNLAATILTTSVNGGAGTLATSSSVSSAGQSAAGQTSTEAQQQVASNSTGNEKKKKKKKEELVRTVGRVTVILPKSS